MIADWPCPAVGEGEVCEYALSFDQGRPHRLLIVPPLFDEANRLRRLLAETMRRLDGAGIDSFLPDLPGCNESTQPLPAQDLAAWSRAMIAAARHFRASHVLAVRGGALVAPQSLPGWRYAPVNGATILRQMLRMRILALREAGREETQAGLIERGIAQGLELAGYALSAGMIAQLQSATPPDETAQSIIGQDMMGGPALWLRAEPDEDPAQADALAVVIAVGIKA
ncbi:hypothetical protein [Novosphingobium sp. TH158]|uniref:hypothetical protein n=1 Tax=Novosphingobium sp. TH158 TaxID=2067455 RepID=UPI000C7C0F26|nr:hypothetical protein [Novosphingobium sp. TH158]PLK25766.1 hypothetical protein C0V78_01810 [Novosphingobium sp. TH158]